MKIAAKDLFFDPDEPLHRRIAKSDTRRGLVHQRTLTPHISTNRERFDPGGAMVTTADKTGVATVSADDAQAIQTNAARFAVIFTPKGEAPADMPHTLIASEGFDVATDPEAE